MSTKEERKTLRRLSKGYKQDLLSKKNKHWISKNKAQKSRKDLNMSIKQFY